MQIAIAVLVLANLLVFVWTGFQASDASEKPDQADTGNLRLLTGYTTSAAQTAPPTGNTEPGQIPAQQVPTQAGTQQPAAGLPLAQDKLTKNDAAQQWATQAKEALSDIPEQENDNAKVSSFQYQPPEKKSAEQKTPGVRVIKLPPDVPIESAPVVQSLVPVTPQSQSGVESAQQKPPPNPTPGEPALPSAPEPPIVQTADSAEPSTQCWRIGPYTSREAAQKAAQKRPQQSRVRRISETMKSVPLGYIVIVPAKDGLDGANQAVRQLRRKKIKDFQIMKSGPFRHAVSLGVFKAKVNAQSWMKALHREGLTQVVVRERIDEQYKYWLELSGKAIMSDSGELQSAYPDVSVRQTDC